MKNLYLLRHAKSSWDNPGLSDKDRPLNKRGLRDAPEMGQRFAARGETLDLVFSSPAKRARTTAELFCDACDYPPDGIVIEDGLYFLGRGAIEEVIENQSDRVNSLMLVFHNPDITHFCNSISDYFRIDNIPTCGLVKWDCDIDRWIDWSRETTQFGYFDYPKNLSGEVTT